MAEVKKVAVKKATEKKTTPKPVSSHPERPVRQSHSDGGSEGSKTKPPVVKKAATSTGLSVQVFDVTGKADGTVTLPKEIFGQPVNKQLVAQAVRVYQTNISTHKAHTKTRGEVNGGGIKPWRQKGTGRARAGSSRSPLWVGGGKTFGPRYRDVKLSLPQKMKRLALISALSSKASAKDIIVITGLEKIGPKTKVVSNLIKSTGFSIPALFVVPEKNENLKLAIRNIGRVGMDTAANLNAYTVLASKHILLSSEAISRLTGETGKVK